MKNWFRLVTIFLNFIIESIIAIVEVRIVASPVDVVVVDNSVASFAAVIVVVKAGFEKY